MQGGTGEDVQPALIQGVVGVEVGIIHIAQTVQAGATWAAPQREGLVEEVRHVAAHRTQIARIGAVGVIAADCAGAGGQSRGVVHSRFHCVSVLKILVSSSRSLITCVVLRVPEQDVGGAQGRGADGQAGVSATADG